MSDLLCCAVICCCVVCLPLCYSRLDDVVVVLMLMLLPLLPVVERVLVGGQLLVS